MTTIILSKTLTEQEFIDNYDSEDMNIEAELNTQFAIDYPNAIVKSGGSLGLQVIDGGYSYEITVNYE